jgi:hypothetical protein
MSQVGEYIYALNQEIEITADTNDLGITNTYVSFVGSGNYNITGFQAPVTDKHVAAIVVVNESSGIKTLKHNDAGSAVGNRIKTAGGVDLAMPPNYIVQLRKIGDFFYVVGAFSV